MPQSIQQIADTVCRAGASFKDVTVKNNSEVKIAGRFHRSGTDHTAVISAVVCVATRDSVNADVVSAFAEKIAEGSSRARMFALDFNEASRILRANEGIQQSSTTYGTF